MKAKVIKTNVVTSVKEVQKGIYEDKDGMWFSEDELDFIEKSTKFSERERNILRNEIAIKAAICLLGQGNLHYNKQIPEIAVEFANDLIKELKKV